MYKRLRLKLEQLKYVQSGSYFTTTKGDFHINYTEDTINHVKVRTYNIHKNIKRQGGPAVYRVLSNGRETFTAGTFNIEDL